MISPVYGQVWRWGFWIRVFGYGIAVRRDSLSYSERHGHARTVRVFGWIVKPLGRASWTSYMRKGTV